MMPEVYLATVIVTTIAIACILGCCRIFFFPEIGVIAYVGSHKTRNSSVLFRMGILEPRLDRSDSSQETVAQNTPTKSSLLLQSHHRPHRMAVLIPYGAYKYNKGGAEREAKRRGDYD